MGILHDPGWPHKRWDSRVWEGDEYDVQPHSLHDRTWELVKGDFAFLPEHDKHDASWDEMYRYAYQKFAGHKLACDAQAPTTLPFGPETWARLNVSGEFKHCLLSLSRWFDDFVDTPNYSQGDIYLRDIAVYRRQNKFFQLEPNCPITFDVRERGGPAVADCALCPQHIPAELLCDLAVSVNEPMAETLASSISPWLTSYQDLLITIPLRRLLILDDNNFLNHWISCGELVEDSDCEEEEFQNLGINRFRAAERVRALVNLEKLSAGQTLNLLHSASNQLIGTPEGETRGVLHSNAYRLGLWEDGAMDTMLPASQSPITPSPHTSSTGFRRELLQRVLEEIRKFVFLDVTDKDIASGKAEVVLLYLSDSDVWSNGPGNNDCQPAANFVFFHNNMAVLFTSHVPHC